MERGYWIRSKPLYGTLNWRLPAQKHVVIAKGVGGVAVLKLFQQKRPMEPIIVIYAQESSAKNYAEIVQTLAPDEMQTANEETTALQMLNVLLANCVMGTQFYVAGDEAFVWASLNVLKQYGVQDRHVEKEIAGTLARPVYCVHCKTVDDAAHHNIHQCSGCGRKLAVRDHFSRRLGAYMGVMVDAEVPGDVPVAEEIYP